MVSVVVLRPHLLEFGKVFRMNYAFCERAGDALMPISYLDKGKDETDGEQMTRK